MKIAISGAQSTGKTTLINRLQEDPDFKDYKFFVNITREIRNQGYPINEQATDTTQELIMREHLRRLDYLGNAIYDRCSLDVMVYTDHFYNRYQVNLGTYLEALEIFKSSISRYDRIFYTSPVDIPLVYDGVRSLDQSFRLRVIELFENYIKTFQLPVTILTGSVDERLRQFKEVIHGNHV